MKILKPGKWTLFVECHTCDAELLLVASDVKVHPATQNAGDKEYFYCVCACCESEEHIPANDLTDDIRKAAYAEAHKPVPRPNPFGPNVVRVT